MIEVHLTDDERKRICAEAARRFEINRARGITGRNGGSVTDIRPDRIGAAGEYALAKHLGMLDSVFLAEVPSRNEPDLPPDIDAKTRQEAWHGLIVQTDAHPEWRYVLLTVGRPMLIVGWLYGHEAMAYPVQDPAGNRPAHFVRPDLLRPMDSFKP